MTAAIATTSLDADLAAGIGSLGLVLDQAARTKLLAYVALLEKWNRTYNLTAIREPARMVTHHLLDALAVLPQLSTAVEAGILAAARPLRVLDVGAGGGIPGIPFAIARPDWVVAMVDSNHKKVSFLTQAAIELGLANVSAHAARIEEFAPAAAFDVVISRAFSDLATFVELAAQHVIPGGLLVAMKGVHPIEELALLPEAIEVLATPALQVPGLDAARHLIIMRKRDR
jgi:16S rRNA (guanine527-N7)-methyltransferase